VKKIFIGVGYVLVASCPFFVLAETFKTDYIDSLIRGGLGIIRNLVIFLISLAVVWFIFNVIRYSMSSEDGDKTKAKDQMIHGIIAIAVIVSVWGLVAILRNAFGVENSQIPDSSINSMIPDVRYGPGN